MRNSNGCLREREDARRYAETALNHTRAALESHARIAGDQSDRGALAMMAEYVYHPLKDKVAELRKTP